MGSAGGIDGRPMHVAAHGVQRGERVNQANALKYWLLRGRIMRGERLRDHVSLKIQPYTEQVYG